MNVTCFSARICPLHFTAWPAQPSHVRPFALAAVYICAGLDRAQKPGYGGMHCVGCAIRWRHLRGRKFVGQALQVSALLLQVTERRRCAVAKGSADMRRADIGAHLSKPACATRCTALAKMAELPATVALRVGACRLASCRQSVGRMSGVTILRHGSTAARANPSSDAQTLGARPAELVAACPCSRGTGPTGRALGARPAELVVAPAVDTDMRRSARANRRDAQGRSILPPRSRNDLHRRSRWVG